MSELLSRVHPSWLPLLQGFSAQLADIQSFLDQEQSRGVHILPARDVIFEAFTMAFDEVRIVIVGQDPYPTRGHAVGLSFSVADEVSPLPKSLRNIFKELQSDIGCRPPHTGDLTPWVNQGVMLLNRALSVREGEAGSHRRIGWDAITLAAIEALAARTPKVVAILWGSDAQQVAGLFDDACVVKSAHPSPLSSYRGFFGSKPFSHANDLLQNQGQPPVSWCLS